MTIELAPDADEYGKTLPVSVMPRPGDSLTGYLLDLDRSCGFPAGTVLRVIRRYSKGHPAMAPAALRQGHSLDLTTLNRLVHFATLADLEQLTLDPLLAWLRRPGFSMRNAPPYRVCPGCLRAGRGIPLVFTIRSIEGCAECGVRLVTECSCTDLAVTDWGANRNPPVRRSNTLRLPRARLRTGLRGTGGGAPP